MRFRMRFLCEFHVLLWFVFLHLPPHPLLWFLETTSSASLHLKPKERESIISSLLDSFIAIISRNQGPDKVGYTVDTKRMRRNEGRAETEYKNIPDDSEEGKKRKRGIIFKRNHPKRERREWQKEIPWNSIAFSSSSSSSSLTTTWFSSLYLHPSHDSFCVSASIWPLTEAILCLKRESPLLSSLLHHLPFS